MPKLEDLYSGLPTGADVRPRSTFSEIFDATVDSTAANYELFSQKKNRADALDRFNELVLNETGEQLPNPEYRLNRDLGFREYEDALAKLREKYPDKRDKLQLPDTYDRMGYAIQREKFDKEQEVLSRAPGGTIGGIMSGAAQFAGGLYESVFDPVTYPTALIPFGAGPVGRGLQAIIKQGAVQGGVQAATELALTPTIHDNMRRIGEEPTAADDATRIAMSGLVGGAIDAGIRGAYRGIQTKLRGYAPMLDDKGGVIGYHPANSEAPANFKAVPGKDGLAKEFVPSPALTPEQLLAIDNAIQSRDPEALRKALDDAGMLDDPAKRGGAGNFETEMVFGDVERERIDDGTANLRVADAILKADNPELPPPGDADVPKPPEREYPKLDPTAKPGTTETLDGKPITLQPIERAKTVDDAEVLASMRKSRGAAVAFEREDGTFILQRKAATELVDDAGEPMAYVFREADGWTLDDARTFAARKNLEEGAASSVDIATMMRNKPGLFDFKIPRTAAYKQGSGLSKLSDTAFERVLKGEISTKQAALIGDHAPKDMHDALIDEIRGAGYTNDNQVKLHIGQHIAEKPMPPEAREALQGLSDPYGVTLPRIKVLDAALGLLRKDKRIFKLLGKEAAKIAGAGNILATASNAKIANITSRLIDIVTRSAMQPSEISRLLTQATREVANGVKVKDAATKFANDVKELFEEKGIEGLLKVDDVPPPRTEIAPVKMDDPFGPEARAQVQAFGEAEKARKAEEKGRTPEADTLVDAWSIEQMARQIFGDEPSAQERAALDNLQGKLAEEGLAHARTEQEVRDIIASRKLNEGADASKGRDGDSANRANEGEESFAPDPLEVDRALEDLAYLRDLQKTPRPETLSSWVKRQGGVKDQGGEISSILGSLNKRPGLVSNSGANLDDLALRAWEEGFFTTPERPTINEFLDRLRDDLDAPDFKNAVIREADQGLREEILNADTLRQELAAQGLLGARTRAQVEKILKDKAAELKDPLAALRSMVEAMQSLESARTWVFDKQSVWGLTDKAVASHVEALELAGKGIVPDGVPLMVTKKIQYIDPETVKVTLMGSLGQKVVLDLDPEDVFGSVALYIPRTGKFPSGGIAFTFFSNAVQSIKYLRAKVGHEASHGAFEHAYKLVVGEVRESFPGERAAASAFIRDFSRLAVLTRDLGPDHIDVLGQSWFEHGSKIGHPDLASQTPNRTIRQDYEDAYSRRFPDEKTFKRAIAQEEVAHFGELWINGAIPDEWVGNLKPFIESLFGKRADQVFTMSDLPDRSGAMLSLRSEALLDLSPEGRKARAKAEGFDVDTVWYHGANRADRIVKAGKFDKRRATSGPMQFFSNDPELSSSYAKGKPDTSLNIDELHIPDYFTVDPKSLGMRGRSPISVERSWYFLTPEQRKTISERAPRVGYENMDQAEGPWTLHPEGTLGANTSREHWDYLLNKESRGNPLTALRKLWYEGGTLVGSEPELMDIYRLAGYPHNISDETAPWFEAQGVIPVYLRMRNPLDTGDADALRGKVIPALKEAFKRDRTRRKEGGADAWDKNTRYTPKEWVEQLEQDVEKGINSYVWTSIPDKVTNELRKLGYDGIKDTGNKGGNPIAGNPNNPQEGHLVAIPFNEEDIRSVNARFDPKKSRIANLLASLAPERLTPTDKLGFYSKALQAAEDLKQEKGTPEQFRSMLRKAGVKEAELRAIDLDRYLEGKQSITKAELVEHIRENQVVVEEARYQDAARSANDNGWSRAGDAPAEGAAGATRWTQYSLDPGNLTYAEHVLHLPSDTQNYETFKAKLVKKYELNPVAPGWARAPLTEEERARLDSLMEKAHVDQETGANRFKSGHWSEPNVIAHIRSQLVTDTKGRKVWNLDELQSDWGQRLRDKGIRDEAKIAELEKRKAEATAKAQKESADLLEELDKADIETKLGMKPYAPGRSDLTPDEIVAARVRRIKERYDDAMWSGKSDEIGDLVGYGVFADEIGDKLRKAWEPYNLLYAELNTAKAVTPGHPLVNTTDQWVGTALRRAVRMAVESGADMITLTPGRVQVDRYGLSKLIDEIGISEPLKYEGAEDGRVRQVKLSNKSGIIASGYVDKNGIIVKGYDKFRDGEGKHLSEYIGKEMAEKVLGRNGPDILSGVDLELGGEGMKKAYDEIYPKALLKMLQKIDPEVKPESVGLAPHDFDTRGMTDAMGNPSGEKYRKWNEYRKGTPFEKDFFAIPLTEKIKAEFLKGQPLFSIRPKKDDPYERLGRAIEALPDMLGANVDPEILARVVDEAPAILERMGLNPDTAEKDLMAALQKGFAGTELEPLLALMGEKAKTADLGRLARAQKLEQDGIDMWLIKRETGWERDNGGNWVYEKGDNETDLSMRAGKIAQGQFETKEITGSLEEIADNPLIIEDYPVFKKWKTTIRSGAPEPTVIDRKKRMITVTQRTKRDALGEIVGAVQELIDEIEGREPARTPAFVWEVMKKQIKDYDRQAAWLVERLHVLEESGNDLDGMRETLLADLMRIRDLRADLEKQNFADVAFRSTGNVRKRNVQNRISLDKKTRDNTPLSYTEDVPREHQVRVTDDGIDPLRSIRGGDEEEGADWRDAWFDDLETQGFAIEQAVSQKSQGRVKAERDTSPIGQAADKLMKDIAAFEKGLLARGETAGEIAKKIENRYGIPVTAEDIAGRMVWWRIEQEFSNAKRYPEGLVDEIARLASRGVTQAELRHMAEKIGEQFNYPVNDATIRNIIRNKGIRAPSGKHKLDRIFTPENAEKLREIVENSSISNLTSRMIAETLAKDGIKATAGQVYRQMERMGLKFGRKAPSGAFGAGRSPPTQWTPEAIAELKLKVAEGMAFTDIAAYLSRKHDLDLTKNAIAGKVKRIKDAERLEKLKAENERPDELGDMVTACRGGIPGPIKSPVPAAQNKAGGKGDQQKPGAE